MGIQIIPAYDHAEDIRQLFSEYTSLLVEGDSQFQKYLELQHYDDELAHLEAKYGFPYGRLYLALWNGNTAGCIALRKIDENTCEMKRLYVRPEYQGNQIGARLVNMVIQESKKIGYKHMKLDTFPFLQIAIGMYQKLGFYQIPKYNDSPMESTIFMQLDL